MFIQTFLKYIEISFGDENTVPVIKGTFNKLIIHI